MPNRLRPLNLVDFTGGVNLRPETFQLAENELPELLNMEVDPRGGLNTRRSWRYAFPDPMTTGTWNPRNAYMHMTSLGQRLIAVANQLTSTTFEVLGKVDNTAATVLLASAAGADPHGADFASWGDDLYIVRGAGQSAFWRLGTTTPLTACAGSNFQNDYTAPGVTDTFPLAQMVTPHAGYMFVAGTEEDGNRNPNRVRWSHPNNPRRWAVSDYVDITEGGQRITGFISFSDRLIIFKPDSVWALFGYNADNWELTNLSRTIGCINQQLVCRSEDAVFFVSWPQGVFAYSEKGNVQELSVQVRAVFERGQMDPSSMRNAFIGWVNRRLWVSLPYLDEQVTPDDAKTVFVLDPVLGSWTTFLGGDNAVPGPYIERVEANDDDACLSFVRQYPRIITVDAESSTATDEIRPTVHGAFPTRMRTRWLDAGNPTWKKSWRRPDLLLRALLLESTVNVQVFHDYDNYNAQRSFFVAYTPPGPTASYGHFVWGDGTTYGGSDQTSSIERGGTMGRAGTVQVLATGGETVRWGLNGIIFKYIPRRFR